MRISSKRLKVTQNSNRKIKRSGKFYVYMLECADGTYYAGHTNDLEKRLKEHNEGKRGAKYTRYKRPVVLVWRKEYKYLKLAAREECRIKKLRRWQKEGELINRK